MDRPPTSIQPLGLHGGCAICGPISPGYSRRSVSILGLNWVSPPV